LNNRACVPVAEDNPARWLETVAETDPDRMFMRTPGEKSYSYGGAVEVTGRYASYLSQCGIGVGDRVAAQVDKSPESFMLYLACLRMGVIYVPLNTAYSKGEIEYFLDDSEPDMLVCRPDALAAMTMLAEKFKVRIVCSLGDNGDGTFAQDAAACGSDDFAAFAGTSADVAALLYTSGTTGRSKGAMITRGALAHCANTLAEAWHFTRHDILLHVLPIFVHLGQYGAGRGRADDFYQAVRY